MKEVFVQEVKVTRNYQITIPSIIKDKLGIKIGDKVLIIYEDGVVKILPKKVNILKIVEEKKPKLGKKIDVDEEIRKSVDEISKILEKEYRK